MIDEEAVRSFVAEEVSKILATLRLVPGDVIKTQFQTVHALADWAFGHELVPPRGPGRDEEEGAEFKLNYLYESARNGGFSIKKKEDSNAVKVAKIGAVALVLSGSLSAVALVIVAIIG